MLLDVEKYLENMRYQANMLLTLINDLLDLAKFETMNFSFNEEYFNLTELVNQAYDTVKYQAAQKNISIIKEYRNDINDTQNIFNNIQLSDYICVDFFTMIKGDKLRYM